MKIENKIPYILTKKVNTNYKLIPFNTSINDIAKNKYLPPVSKEWKNSVYSYNKNNIINYPVYDLNINSLIKGYFSLYFNSKFIKHRYFAPKDIRKSNNKILVSKAEIKHTNSKALVTIYVHNRERFLLLKKIKKYMAKAIAKLIYILLCLNGSNEYKIVSNLPYIDLKSDHEKYLISKVNKQLMLKLEPLGVRVITKKQFLSKIKKMTENPHNEIYLSEIYKIIDNPVLLSALYNYFSIKPLLKKILKIHVLIRRFRLRLNLNKFKFEDKLLYKLGQYIGKYYNKKIEFNIVNLKSIAYHGDIFIKILASKTKKERSNALGYMNRLLEEVKLPKVNRIVETSRISKKLDTDFLGNKYKNLNISSIINNQSLLKDSLNPLLYNIYNKNDLEKENLNNMSSNSKEIQDIIFENLKYKNIGGVKLAVKGRLTKRYRADRSIYRLKFKGGLRNVDSSFKGLSTVIKRGYLDSNVEKSRVVSKRRIGSFAVTGWFSSK